MSVTTFSREVLLVLTTATVAAAGVAFWWLKSKARKFVPVARIKKIFVYPIKAVPGIEVPYVHCVREGPKFEDLRDRCMLLLEGDIFVTQRQEPSLALLRLSYNDGNIYIRAEGMPTVSLPAFDKDATNKESKTVRVRKHTYTAVDAPEEVSAWFGQYLKKDGIRLVRILQEECSRPKGTPIAFQDEASFHVLSEASIGDLNSRMSEERVSERNFRPNFLIEGCEAYAEDKWLYVQVGDAVIEFFDRCARCLQTLVDPDTGIKSIRKEPLNSLRAYRVDTSEEGKEKYAMDPLFGVLYFLYKKGVARVGDQVHAVVVDKPLL
uniref:Putative conserved secreted protein n=1 Tax=Ornithodoros turicata TaxID=34597 RepID=A0A2R5LF11_9ACAR